MHIQIKFRWSDKILFEGEYASTKECLTDAVLTGADLRGADLTGADLTGADLRGAVLTDAVLRDADLTGADLTGAVLRGADLTGADLRGAVLTDAVLRDADLTGADLRDAVLTGFKTDLIAEILKLPNELENLRETLIAGKIDGSTYTGECACLAGTIANHRKIEGMSSGKEIQENGIAFIADSSSPREQWFMNIRKGDTPETNHCAKFALEWIDEAISIRDHIRKSA